jgi:hypothetical protein
MARKTIWALSGVISHIEFTAAHEKVTLGIRTNKAAFMVNEFGAAHGAGLPPVFLRCLSGRSLLRYDDRRAHGRLIGSGHRLFVLETPSSDKDFLGGVYVDFALRSYYSCVLGELTFSRRDSRQRRLHQDG